MQNLIEYIQHHSRQLQPIPTGEKFRVLNKKDPPQKLQAILFDIYGTLFISASGDISLAGNKPSGSDQLQNVADYFHVNIRGNDLPSLFLTEVQAEHDRLRAEGIKFPEVRVEEIWARILRKDLDRDFIEAFALGYEIAVNPVFPMPGLSGALEEIKSRGIPIGIVSNAQFFTPLLFPAFLGKAPDSLGFDRNLCFYSYEFRQGKPDTFLYVKSAEALLTMGISPQHTLFVGNDMRNDILPADSLGYQTALFAGDKRSLRWREEIPGCRAISPNYVLASLTDLSSLLDMSLSS